MDRSTPLGGGQHARMWLRPRPTYTYLPTHYLTDPRLEADGHPQPERRWPRSSSSSRPSRRWWAAWRPSARCSRGRADKSTGPGRTTSSSTAPSPRGSVRRSRESMWCSRGTRSVPSTHLSIHMSPLPPLGLSGGGRRLIQMAIYYLLALHRHWDRVGIPQRAPG